MRQNPALEWRGARGCEPQPHTYPKKFARRKRRIRGLWKRNERFFAHIAHGGSRGKSQGARREAIAGRVGIGVGKDNERSRPCQQSFLVSRERNPSAPTAQRGRFALPPWGRGKGGANRPGERFQHSGFGLRAFACEHTQCSFGFTIGLPNLRRDAYRIKTRLGNPFETN